MANVFFVVVVVNDDALLSIEQFNVVVVVVVVHLLKALELLTYTVVSSAGANCNVGRCMAVLRAPSALGRWAVREEMGVISLLSLVEVTDHATP